MLKRLGTLLPVILRLGLLNVAAVGVYRVAIRCGLLEKLLPRGMGYRDAIFQAPTEILPKPREILSGNSVVKEAEELLAGNISYFSHHTFQMGSPPDWFRNPINGLRYADPGRHWSKIGDFDGKIGDIKLIWEPSRFDWTLIFARAFRVSGDIRFLDALNEWITDWITRNPLNTGPNWKCGQETGIRMLQVLLAAFLLRQHQSPSRALVRFVSEHCGRIEPTIRYAISQDNNHGTSEAAALFIGGAWLEQHAPDPVLRLKGSHWRYIGRKWLENRVDKLVGKDGSFSQHSLNYHRLLVDTLNLVEFWRRGLDLEEFSGRYQSRCQAAVNWLYQMVDQRSGDAPNLGPNDGARLFVLSDTDYRDFRPSVQLGCVLFFNGKVYPDGLWNDPLAWLDLTDRNIAGCPMPKETREFPDGGYVVFSGGNDACGVLRYPKFRFRPGHADAFHFDLWHRGVNVLRGPGSYSYNAEEPWAGYFSSTKAHNTVELDGRNQMPSISRFLRGSWLKLNSSTGLQFKDGKTTWSGSYKDYQGGRHKRTIENNGTSWTIVDEIEGFANRAILRWRLAPGNWQISGIKCFNDFGEIDVISSVPIKRLELVEGWESRYYFQKSPLPVLEVEVEGNRAVLQSEIRLK